MVPHHDRFLGRMMKYIPDRVAKAPFQALIVALIGLFGMMADAVAQTNVLESDPIRARKLIVYDMWGAYVGPSFNSQGGTFTTDCDCEFTGGASTGIAIGGMFEKLTRSGLQWGVMAGYENRSIEGRFREIEGVVQRAPSNGQAYTVPIEFLNVGSLSLHYLTATPYVKYTVFNALFARAGAGLSYIFSNNLTHTKSLVSDSVTFPNGERASVSIPGEPDGEVVLQDGPIPEVNALQISLTAAVGAELRLSKRMFLSPVLQYSYPFTVISGGGEGYSVRAFQLLVEARFIL